MPGIHDNILVMRPSLVDWDVIQIIMPCMKHNFGSTVLNQCSSKEWLLSEAIMDLIQNYTYCSGKDASDDVSKHLDTMVEERGNSPDL